MKDVHCIKCSGFATFMSPNRYCNYHWAEWWAKYLPKKQQKLEIERILRRLSS